MAEEREHLRPVGTMVTLTVNVPANAPGSGWAMLRVLAQRFNEIPDYWAEAFTNGNHIGIRVVLDALPPVPAVEDFIEKTHEIRSIVRDTYRRGSGHAEP